MTNLSTYSIISLSKKLKDFLERRIAIKKDKLTQLKKEIENLYQDEYSLLSTEYINARTKLKFKHNLCGTIFDMRADAFFGKQKQQCPNKECVKQRIENTNLQKYGVKCTLSNTVVRNKAKKTMEQRYGADSFFKNGLIQKKMNETYGITSSNQMNIDKKYIDILHNYSLLKQWSNLFQQNNSRPPNILDFAKESNYDITNIYKIIKDNKWELNDFFKIETSSIYEQTIKDFLDKNNIEYSLHNRNVIPPLEIDFFIPKFNIGIEVNGICCHSSSKYLNFPPKDRRYHQEKSLECEKNSIRLIHIFEWELLPENNKKIFDYLDNIFNINITNIYARKCKIKEITNYVANSFYEVYHLQGKTSNSKYNYGLFFNEELISCMTFSIKKDICTLSRFCTKSGYRVIGGASKLFTYFIKQHNPQKIISFSDITKMSGKVYDKLGFKIEGITAPSYWWVKRNNIVYWRRDCQKQYMHRLYGFDENYKYKEHKNDDFWQQSEKEIMESKGYLQIFDAGMKKYVWRK